MLLLVAIGAQVRAEEPEGGRAAQARAILEERCFRCHGDRRQRGGLRLDTREHLLAGGDTGLPAAIAGDPEQSLLVRAIRGENPDFVMPPSGERLTAEESEVLVAWIRDDLGREVLSAASRATAEIRSDHWAYQRPERPPVPRVANPSLVRNPIDAFVLRRLDERGLHPAEEAERRTLIRRVSIDLTGLPPAPAQVRAFVEDPAPDAYEKLVDRLLASPRYAEHGARHWLDLARYADSQGFTIDGARTIWPYRDWVIRAIDADLPFDRFTIEQLAGDLLPGATTDQIVATGFHRNTMVNQEGGADDEEFRIYAAMDRVHTTATVWLGTTLACAQCHSHKYDPITQQDYYRFYAFFDQTEDGGVTSGPRIEAPSPAQQAERARIDAEIAKLETERERRAGEFSLATARYLREITEDGTDWVVKVPAVASDSGSSFEVAEDGGVEAVGDGPPADTYEITFDTRIRGIRGLRLEVLADPSRGDGGPGRAENGNLVLNEVIVEAAPREAPERFEPVALRAVSADHFQHRLDASYWPPEHCIDGDAETGWAILPETGKDHQLVFEFAEPIGADGGARLRVRLKQSYGREHTIARFRVAVTADPIDHARTRIPAAIEAIARLDPAARTAEQRARLDAHALAHVPELAAIAAQIERLEELRPRPPTTLVMRERETPRETRVFLRGNFLTPGPRVEPGVPAVLPAIEAPEDRRLNRLDLARWLVGEGNPLSQRVTVNRWWQHFFGKGLMETENDFGTRGSRPTHPQLLDWLATELVERGYSRKAIHRLIVTSGTYRQSARTRADLQASDARNLLLARQNRLRFEAEVIRDSALAVSGLLHHEVGGPPVYPPQPDGVFRFTQTEKDWPTSTGPDRHRRTMYTWLWRSSLYPFLGTFDAPDGTITCTRRNRSNTPLQALTMANDPMMMEIARGFARRLLGLPAASDAERVAAGFEICMARPPTAIEQERLVRYFEAQRRDFEADPASARRFLAAEADDPARVAAFLGVARVLLNLDEFLTRG